MHLTKCGYVIDENFQFLLELLENNANYAFLYAAFNENKLKCPISIEICENGYPMDFQKINTGGHVESSGIG